MRRFFKFLGYLAGELVILPAVAVAVVHWRSNGRPHQSCPVTVAPALIDVR